MYARAIIKNRSGEKFTVEARVNCDVIAPTNIMDTGARLKYAFHTNKLLLAFYKKLRPYANKDHAIENIQTDNLYLLNKFAEEGHSAEFMPDLEGCENES